MTVYFSLSGKGLNIAQFVGGRYMLKTGLQMSNEIVL